MQPLGCFGSSLAFAPASQTCIGCAEVTACEALVTNRRPVMMRLLDKFVDAQGKPMSLGWMTKAERKQVRDAEKAAELAEAAADTFGDEVEVMELKAHLDKRAHSTIDRFVKMRINPKIASLEVVGGVSRTMATVLGALRERPHDMRDLVACVASRCAATATSAQRDTYATVSILTACDRLTRNGSTLELK